MTEKDIVRLAEEAELWLHTDRKYEAVEKFAKLVAAEEREACAKIADVGADGEDPYCCLPVANSIAKDIRARGQG